MSKFYSLNVANADDLAHFRSKPEVPFLEKKY